MSVRSSPTLPSDRHLRQLPDLRDVRRLPYPASVIRQRNGIPGWIYSLASQGSVQVPHQSARRHLGTSRRPRKCEPGCVCRAPAIGLGIRDLEDYVASATCCDRSNGLQAYVLKYPASLPMWIGYHRIGPIFSCRNHMVAILAKAYGHAGRKSTKKF